MNYTPTATQEFIFDVLFYSSGSSVFMPILHYFDECSFGISFEVKKHEISGFVLFKFIFAIQGLLRFDVNHRVDLSVQENAIGFSLGIDLNVLIAVVVLTLDNTDFQSIDLAYLCIYIFSASF